MAHLEDELMRVKLKKVAELMRDNGFYAFEFFEPSLLVFRDRTREVVGKYSLETEELTYL